MSIIQTAFAVGAPNGTLTFATTPTPGNLLLCFGTPFASYTLNGNFLVAASLSDDNTGLTRCFYRYVQAGDTTVHSVFVPGNGSFWTLGGYEISSVSGVLATDVETITHAKVLSGTSFTSSIVLVANTGDLVLGYAASPQGGTPTSFGTGWTLTGSASNLGYGRAQAHRNQYTNPGSAQMTVTPGSLAFSRVWMMAIIKQPLAPPPPGGTDGLRMWPFANTIRTFPLNSIRKFPTT